MEDQPSLEACGYIVDRRLLLEGYWEGHVGEVRVTSPICRREQKALAEFGTARAQPIKEKTSNSVGRVGGWGGRVCLPDCPLLNDGKSSVTG